MGRTVGQAVAWVVVTSGPTGYQWLAVYVEASNLPRETLQHVSSLSEAVQQRFARDDRLRGPTPLRALYPACSFRLEYPSEALVLVLVNVHSRHSVPWLGVTPPSVCTTKPQHVDRLEFSLSRRRRTRRRGHHELKLT